MKKRIIIDAYNFIRTNPLGAKIEETKGHLSAKEWLVSLCKDALKDGEELLLVFDGSGEPSAEEIRGGTIFVRYSSPCTADEIVRESAENALAMKIKSLIVSSDNEVRVLGSDFQDCRSFFDYLIREKNRTPKENGFSETIQVNNLLKYLTVKGHIQPDTFIEPNTGKSIAHLLRYLSIRTQKPQKIAREVEKLLRNSVVLKPDPDPQKKVFRSIKLFFDTSL